eukprot:TRINITY_DN31289_c1_g1_i2.p1 TRINITY_DN31289_c1_g1~~TRINITY_DN31289_c1_g1_i2.p1  ORF type:complete len:812 (-),score=160.04 TRINITY_DN31289_c1_g1_i2:764-3199(-)
MLDAPTIRVIDASADAASSGASSSAGPASTSSLASSQIVASDSRRRGAPVGNSSGGGVVGGVLFSPLVEEAFERASNYSRSVVDDNSDSQKHEDSGSELPQWQSSRPGSVEESRRASVLSTGSHWSAVAASECHWDEDAAKLSGVKDEIYATDAADEQHRTSVRKQAQQLEETPAHEEVQVVAAAADNGDDATHPAGAEVGDGASPGLLAQSEFDTSVSAPTKRWSKEGMGGRRPRRAAEDDAAASVASHLPGQHRLSSSGQRASGHHLQPSGNRISGKALLSQDGERTSTSALGRAIGQHAQQQRQRPQQRAEENKPAPLRIGAEVQRETRSAAPHGEALAGIPGLSRPSLGSSSSSVVAAAAVAGYAQGCQHADLSSYSFLPASGSNEPTRVALPQSPHVLPASSALSQNSPRGLQGRPVLVSPRHMGKAAALERMACPDIDRLSPRSGISAGVTSRPQLHLGSRLIATGGDRSAEASLQLSAGPHSGSYQAVETGRSSTCDAAVQCVESAEKKAQDTDVQSTRELKDLKSRLFAEETLENLCVFIAGEQRQAAAAEVTELRSELAAESEQAKRLQTKCTLYEAQARSLQLSLSTERANDASRCEETRAELAEMRLEEEVWHRQRSLDLAEEETLSVFTRQQDAKLNEQVEVLRKQNEVLQKSLERSSLQTREVFRQKMGMESARSLEVSTVQRLEAEVQRLHSELSSQHGLHRQAAAAEDRAEGLQRKLLDEEVFAEQALATACDVAQRREDTFREELAAERHHRVILEMDVKRLLAMQGEEACPNNRKAAAGQRCGSSGGSHELSRS